MKRVRILLAAAVLASAALAVQAPGASALTVNCGVKSYTFLWWPNGHAAIPSVGFPAFPVPHIEFYKPGNMYPNSNSLGYADARGGGGFSTRCRKVSRGSVSSRVPNAGSASRSTALKCTFPRTPKLDLARAANGIRVHAYLGGLSVVSAKLSASGSSLSFTKTYCRKTPPPH